MGFFFSSWAYRILCQCAIAESQLLKTLYVQVTALVIISNRRHIKSLSHNCSWLTWNSYATFLGTLLDISHGLPYQLIRNEALFCCSVTQSCLTLFYPVGLQHTGLPCPSPSLQSLLKLMSSESVMPSNHLILCYTLLLLPSSFPASVFPVSQLFASAGQSIRASAPASILPMNIQG